jgi:hypothetical protein
MEFNLVSKQPSSDDGVFPVFIGVDLIDHGSFPATCSQNKCYIIIFCCVLIADLHWERAGVSEPLQKVGSLLWGTGEGISLQGTVPTSATHVSISSLSARLP